MDKVSVFAPASVGNAGACYDIMGYALDYVGDFVTLERVDRANSSIIWAGVEGPHASDLEDVDYCKNAAWVVANYIWVKFVGQTSVNFSLRLKLHKYMPVGSGMGSSASSSVAAAAAIITLLGLKIEDSRLVPCLESGEEVSSGVGHPDNVVPSYFGGFYLISEQHDPQKIASTCKRRYIRIEGGDSLVSVAVRPEIKVMTGRSRRAVRDYIREVYLGSPSAEPADLLLLVREESAKAAEMVYAVMTNNAQMVGEVFNKNYLLEAARSRFIPYFHEVKAAALKAGAYGCTIAGSGPTMVAITDDKEKAEHIRDAMVTAFDGLAPRWLISPIGKQGARVVDSIEGFVTNSIGHHNFFSGDRTY